MPKAGANGRTYDPPMDRAHLFSDEPHFLRLAPNRTNRMQDLTARNLQSSHPTIELRMRKIDARFCKSRPENLFLGSKEPLLSVSSSFDHTRSPTLMSSIFLRPFSV